MRRFLIILAVVFTSVLAAGATDSAAPLTRDEFVSSLAGNISTHFNLEGELQLELLRSWTAPGRLARDWAVDVSEYPSVLASSMLVRCRLLADGEIAGEYTLTLHAALWRDAWAARQPVPVNGTFDPALLETRRIDFLRERD